MLFVKNLRCEYKINPIGIDVGIDAMRPRLSWELHSDRCGVVQEACRIQVFKAFTLKDLVDISVSDASMQGVSRIDVGRTNKAISTLPILGMQSSG